MSIYKDFTDLKPGSIITFRYDLKAYNGRFGYSTEMLEYAGHKVEMTDINPDGVVHVRNIGGTPGPCYRLHNWTYHADMFEEFYRPKKDKLSIPTGPKAKPYDGLVKEGPTIIISNTPKLIRF